MFPDWGKPLYKKSAVQTEIRRKGRGGWKPIPNGMWEFFSEYKPLLRHLICTIFDHYLSWYPPEYHLRTKSDHIHCQNIISQSQNRCFNKFTDFGENSSHKASVCLRVGGRLNVLTWNATYLAAFRLNRNFLYWGLPLVSRHFPSHKCNIVLSKYI